MKPLININLKLQDQARKLLDETGLINTLGKYGRVHVNGSFIYGTMVDRDIDIAVIVESESDITTSLRSQLVSDLLLIDSCIGMKLTDRKLSPKEGRARGVWVSPQFEMDGLWQLDIWIVPKNDPNSHIGDDLETKMKSINDEQRYLILEIKSYVLENGIKQKGVSSVKIYNDILSGRVTSLSDWINTFS